MIAAHETHSDPHPRPVRLDPTAPATFRDRIYWFLNSWLVSAIIPLLLFAYGMWTYPLALLGPDRFLLPGDLGDTRFNNYILEHFHQYITGGVRSYWDAPFMYPWPNVIAHSDNLLGTAPFYSAFRHFEFNRESAFQLWLVLLFALNYWCCFLALKAWSGRTVLAACGAFIFAFGIYSVSQTGHAQVYPRFMIPLAFLGMWRFLSTGRPIFFAATAIAVVYQFYCGIYLGFLLLYALFFLLVAHAIANRGLVWFQHTRPWPQVRMIIVVSLISAAILAPLMLPYMKVAETMGTREFHEVIATMPRPESYFFTHPAALSWRALSEHSQFAFPEWWAHFHFVGIIPWLAILALPLVLLNKRVIPSHRTMAVTLVLAWFLSMVFCMNFSGFTLYHIFFHLPGFSALRSLDRFIHVQAMFFILLFVVVTSAIPRRAWPSYVAALLFPVLVALDNRVEVTDLKRFDKWKARELVQAVERDVTAQYSGIHDAIAYTPILSLTEDERVHDRVIEINLTAMLAAQHLRIPIVNAYTGSYPQVFIAFFDDMDRSSLVRWCDHTDIDPSTIQMIDDLHIPFISTDTVVLQAANGMYVCTDITRDALAFANREKPLLWEKYRAIYLEGDRIAFRAHNSAFLCAELLRSKEISATAPVLGDFGIFAMEQHADGLVALRAHDGSYLTLDTASHRMFASADRPGIHELFRITSLTRDTSATALSALLDER